LSETKLQTSN